jgi:protein phosphatase
MAGEISMEKIKSDRQKDSLTSFVGNEKLPFIDANKKGFTIRRGDTLVLCSDGVYNGIFEADMINILTQNEPQPASETISQTVLEKNIAGQDNLTIMIIKLED